MLANERAWISELETKMANINSKRIVMEDRLKTIELQAKATKADAQITNE